MLPSPLLFPQAYQNIYQSLSGVQSSLFVGIPAEWPYQEPATWATQIGGIWGVFAGCPQTPPQSHQFSLRSEHGSGPRHWAPGIWFCVSILWKCLVHRPPFPPEGWTPSPPKTCPSLGPAHIRRPLVWFCPQLGTSSHIWQHTPPGGLGWLLLVQQVHTSQQSHRHHHQTLWTNCNVVANQRSVIYSMPFARVFKL